jgi:hypothetical protein
MGEKCFIHCHPILVSCTACECLLQQSGHTMELSDSDYHYPYLSDSILHYYTFLPSLDDNRSTSYWKSVSDMEIISTTGISLIRCALNQYLSGLAFYIDPMVPTLSIWSAKCTNVSLGHQKREGFCWIADITLV